MKTRNSIMKTVNNIAVHIRENEPVKFGQLCMHFHIAPSTLYGYIKILGDLFEDIKYEQGEFHVAK